MVTRRVFEMVCHADFKNGDKCRIPMKHDDTGYLYHTCYNCPHSGMRISKFASKQLKKLEKTPT